LELEYPVGLDVSAVQLTPVAGVRLKPPLPSPAGVSAVAKLSLLKVT
jgi:hypothetical protein